MNQIKKMLFLKKELMMKNGVKRGIILAVISLFSFQVTFAQRITRQYNNVSFSAALKDLSHQDEGDRPCHHRGVYAEICHQDDRAYRG